MESKVKGRGGRGKKGKESKVKGTGGEEVEEGPPPIIKPPEAVDLPVWSMSQHPRGPSQVCLLPFPQPHPPLLTPYPLYILSSPPTTP